MASTSNLIGSSMSIINNDKQCETFYYPFFFSSAYPPPLWPKQLTGEIQVNKRE